VTCFVVIALLLVWFYRGGRTAVLRALAGRNTPDVPAPQLDLSPSLSPALLARRFPRAPFPAAAFPAAALPAVEVPPDAEISEVVIEAPEPRFAAPTLRDRIGRIWAPVLINGPRPLSIGARYRRDAFGDRGAGAKQSRFPVAEFSTVRVTGVTGSAIVPTIAVSRMDVGELSMTSSVLPIVADVFWWGRGRARYRRAFRQAQSLSTSVADKVVIIRSKGELARVGFATLPLRPLRDHLLALDVLVGGVRAKAIIDTGAQISIGNNALRGALMRHELREVRKIGDRGCYVGCGGGRHHECSAYYRRVAEIHRRQHNLRRHVHIRALEAQS